MRWWSSSLLGIRGTGGEASTGAQACRESGGVVMCDVYYPDGRAHETNSRFAAAEAMEKAKDVRACASSARVHLLPR